VKSVGVVTDTEKICYVTFVLSVAKKQSSIASTANINQNKKIISNAICAVDITSASSTRYTYLVNQDIMFCILHGFCMKCFLYDSKLCLVESL